MHRIQGDALREDVGTQLVRGAAIAAAGSDLGVHYLLTDGQRHDIHTIPYSLQVHSTDIVFRHGMTLHLELLVNQKVVELLSGLWCVLVVLCTLHSTLDCLSWQHRESLLHLSETAASKHFGVPIVKIEDFKLVSVLGDGHDASTIPTIVFGKLRQNMITWLPVGVTRRRCALTVLGDLHHQSIQLLIHIKDLGIHFERRNCRSNENVILCSLADRIGSNGKCLD